MNNENQTPINEWVDKTRKKLNSNPLSLSAMAYREFINESPELIVKEAQLIRQAYLEGYRAAFEDLKNHYETKGNDAPIERGFESFTP
jgi:hypothetical protein